MGTTLYEKDFHAWARQETEVIRAGQVTELDFEHIAEKLEAMTKSESRELTSRLAVLISHLLKWQLQLGKRSRSWRSTMDVQRTDIMDLLEDSPSLRHEIEKKIERAYTKARILAEAETGMECETFQETCPFLFSEIVNQDFWPD